MENSNLLNDLELESKTAAIEKLYSGKQAGISVYSSPEFTLLKANQFYLDIMCKHYDIKEDILGMKLDEFAPWWKGSKAEEVFKITAASGETYYGKEYDGKIGDLKGRYFQDILVPIVEKGEVKFIILIVEDVTSRVLQTEKIKEQKDQLEAIIDNISDGLLIFDKEGRYVIQNEAARRFARNNSYDNIYDPLKEIKYFDLNGNELPDSDVPSLRILSGTKFANYIVATASPQGINYLNISGTPIFDEDGSVCYGILCVRNITEQTIQSKLILKQKEELETIIENMSDALIVINRDGSYRCCNKRACEITYIAEDFRKLGETSCSTKFYDINGKKLNRDEFPVSKVLKGDRVENIIIKAARPDSTKYLSFNGSPVFGKNGDIVSAIVCIRDMTGYIEKEQALEDSRLKLLKAEKAEMEALKKTIEMKDDFLSLVSHEFRTPLNVINTAIQALEYICAEELSSTAKSFIRSIRQNCYRQLRLVNNLLDITRINSGRIKMHKRNQDIVFLTKSITESVYTYAMQKNITLSFTSTFRKKIIGIDEEKFERILLNLLSNGIKFTPHGKSITVRLHSKNKMVCLEVKDEGIGIPKDKIDIIFERFEQVDSSLSRQAEGTGIGLSLVKRFVEALGGSISVESKVGEGSTFMILLPDEEAAEDPDDMHMADLLDNRLIETTSVEFSDIYL